ncbi:MAG: hypothetical protein NTV80_10845 [Verrucomicrobia bacterium]|nr:hypothetical protein [Verrucomicrobiota bacterium]
MKPTLFKLLTFFFCAPLMMADQTNSDAESETATKQKGAEEKTAFVFDEQPYFQRESKDGLREYLTEGETFEKWSTLVSIREIEGVEDARAYAFQTVKNAKADSPNNNGQVIGNEESGTYFADFLMFPPEGSDITFAEWNIMRITKTAAGIQQLQYARRFYDFDVSTAKIIKADREKIMGQLATLEIPVEAAADVQTYSYPNEEKTDFAVSFPAPWEMKKTKRGVFVESSDKHLAMNVFIIDTAEVTEEEESLKKQVGENFKEILWNDGNDPEVAGGDDVGLTSVTHKGVASDGEGTQKHLLFLISYVKKEGDKSLILLCQCPFDSVEKYGDTLDAVIKSVKVRL